MVSLVDIAAGDVTNIDFMHPHINSYYIYWEILDLSNFSNNKLLYIVILLLPFVKCFISVNECIIRKSKTWQD